MPASHIALASDWPHYDGTPGCSPASEGDGDQGGRRPHAGDGHARALVPVALMAFGLVANAAERRHTALVCGERRLNYGALDRLVNRTAHAMAARGGGRSRSCSERLEFFAVTNAAASSARWPCRSTTAGARRAGLRARRRGARRADPRSGLPRGARARGGRTADARSRARPRRGAGLDVVCRAGAAPDTTAGPCAERLQHRHLHLGHDRTPEACPPHRPGDRVRGAEGLVEMWGFRPDDVHRWSIHYHTMPARTSRSTSSSAPRRSSCSSTPRVPAVDRDRARDDVGHGARASSASSSCGVGARATTSRACGVLHATHKSRPT